MGDMMGGNMMDCAAKGEQNCCTDSSFKSDTCIPFYFCQIAVGHAPPGPYPQCGGPANGDAAKCKESDSDLNQKSVLALKQCHDTLQGLYDLEKGLLQCVHEIVTCKADIEKESSKAQETAVEAHECQATEQGAGHRETVNKQMRKVWEQPCVEVETAIDELVAAKITCIAASLPKIEIREFDIPKIEFEIPKFDIEIPGIPDINIQIGTPEFNISKLDVKAPDFQNPSVTVPGGGGPLDAPVGTAPITIDARRETVQAKIDKCVATKSQCEPAKKQAAQTRAEQEEVKAGACKDSLVQIENHKRIDPKEVITMLEEEKKMPFFQNCAEVSVKFDALIEAVNFCSK